MYSDRFYRDWTTDESLVRFGVRIRQSDLSVAADYDLSEMAIRALSKARREVEEYSEENPTFATSLGPVPWGDDPPEVVRSMLIAADRWDMGPMAAVAGALAESVGRFLLRYSDTVVVENGGDVFARGDRPLSISLYPGEDSPFSHSLMVEVDAREVVGICSSSAVVGPSLSLGCADLVTAVARCSADADAAATAIANRIKGPGDVGPVLEEERRSSGLLGLVACCGSKMGLWGELKLVSGNREVTV
ncbi:UPF0280 family protein [Candidatus Fermentibacteria bacterium]|nr:UPF0280 family protein [Candidatus Fermentibacteria bacterium]